MKLIDGKSLADPDPNAATVEPLSASSTFPPPDSASAPVIPQVTALNGGDSRSSGSQGDGNVHEQQGNSMNYFF